jgi:hypothetical protein
MTEDALESILANVKFRDWKFTSGPLGDGWFVQARFCAPDTRTGEMAAMGGRKFYVSPYAIPDEVVKTCWVAVELALRHEAMEEFTYLGVAPFHPHTDVEALCVFHEFTPHVRREPS